MVRVQEIKSGSISVDDEHDSEFTDTSSTDGDFYQLDDSSYDDYRHESLMDRVEALKYIIPYSIRSGCHTVWMRGKRYFASFVISSGRWVWILTTSLFLVGFPLFFEYQKLQQLKLDNSAHFSPYSDQDKAIRFASDL